ncbi:MAG: ribose-5-phosphate isomerase, partial [Saprospiraceae bacterium]|nr:ribose-5-phosphate isomerase [Bacteroidia bacterium]NNL93376.1 ribose-5-phosphate isomerase [Saprospiraceae bacterium]
GMTSLSPNERFKKHKTGARSKKGHKISSYFVEKYGTFLRPSLYEHLNPMTRTEAVKMEEELALSLRRKGYAVWWN